MSVISYRNALDGLRVHWNIIFLSVQCNTMQYIGRNIKSRKRVRRPSGVCGQDCDVIYGPIFTKF